MKSFLLAVAAILALTVGTSYAAEFKLSDGLHVRESLGFGLSKDTKKTVQPDGTVVESNGRGAVFGLFSGSVGGYHTANDYRILGFGGVAVYASSSIASAENVQYAVQFVPLTFFNDTFQLGIGRNFTAKERMVTLGMTMTSEEITRFFPEVLK